MTTLDVLEQPHSMEKSPQTISHNELANAIRTLSMDAVEKAKSGHPGMPMGMADVATVLFSKFLKFNPLQPNWADRDRFILSAGHGSMLLYSLLYLTGYEDMTLEEIKNFRQLGARSCGHPEFGEAHGIETTTGPLGQGIGNAVGMALAEKMLGSHFPDLVDHYTYTIAGDGCLMEGISQEAISLAGHLKLGKLIVLFDDNGISIDGPTSLTITEDQGARFAASGWHVQAIDGHDPKAIEAAIAAAKAETSRPSMIACKTTIGYSAPTKAGKSSCHGSPLGADEIAGSRKTLGWEHEPFVIPDAILAEWRKVGKRGEQPYQAWTQKLNSHKDKAAFEARLSPDLPANLGEVFQSMKQEFASLDSIATRQSSGKVLEKLFAAVPQLVGGSADLTGSNLTQQGLKGVTPDDASGRYIFYGVREHAMCAMMNGLALHGGFIPYSGTFFVFTDYCRPSIRLAALMHQRVIYVMTHDSIGVGEDGPTHQPVEHLASLRAMPNLFVYRPADTIETAECWQLALEKADAPSMLVLTRQNVPNLRKNDIAENKCAKGGYVLAEEAGAKVTLIATGSEVGVAMAAREELAKAGIAARVVSMPCTTLFDQQPADYQEAVLGKDTLKVAIEAASRYGWEHYIRRDGIFIGMEGFGASAPGNDLFKHFGITAENVVKQVKAKLGK